jgi:phage anti-repressor protein
MDLVAKDLPILETKELTKRVRRLMIQNGTIEPTEQEIEDLGLNQPQQPDPQQMAITTNIEMQTEKLMSDIEVQEAKAQQGFIKLENDMNKQQDDFALKLTELEEKIGKQLNAELKQNMLVFDPAIGDFVNATR